MRGATSAMPPLTAATAMTTANNPLHLLRSFRLSQRYAISPLSPADVGLPPTLRATHPIIAIESRGGQECRVRRREIAAAPSARAHASLLSHPDVDPDRASSKPKVSRKRRSRNRRYPASRK